MSSKVKYMAFGDIHGCFKAAESAVAVAGQCRARAVFLGDYVDYKNNGKEAISENLVPQYSCMQVLKTLISAKESNPDWVFLRGNHDQMLLDLINGKEHPQGYDSRTREQAYADWLISPGDFQSQVVNFLQNTHLYFETSQFIFVHAPLRDTQQDINEKIQEELIWNYDFDPAWKGKRFIHGHRLTEEVSYNQKGININTECGYGGFLTGLLLSDKTAKILECFKIAENGIVISISLMTADKYTDFRTKKN
ncbi:metallophosphoesterase [Flavobacterium ovatum]|uniref:metallophosphoesterase n=1 Tax=Flavobacterium ovatum TaxID=1928857 RepID=UPI00344B9DE1